MGALELFRASDELIATYIMMNVGLNSWLPNLDIHS
jgi:hypothetical protein